jgi:hypothetical protein
MCPVRAQRTVRCPFQACQEALQTKPYMAPELQDHFAPPALTPVMTLKKMQAVRICPGKRGAFLSFRLVSWFN